MNINYSLKKMSVCFVVLVFLFLGSFVFSSEVQAGFRFVAWADTRGNNTELAHLSNQVKVLPIQPAFTIYPGDLIPTNSAFSPEVRFQNWKAALDGGNNNGLTARTFASRGGHDMGYVGDTDLWVKLFQPGPLSDPGSVASVVGVSNYQALNTDLTYSFDYQNSHFVAVDAYGNANTLTVAQQAWMNDDLSSAAARGMKHAFLFWHGPIYTVNGHMSSVPTALVTMLNNHPIISAGFFGHEHVLAHTTLDKSRVPQFTNRVMEQFVSGGAGAGFYSCTAGRSDFCQPQYGFLTVDVLSDTQFRAAFYKDGSTTPIFENTYTKGEVGPGPTITPTVSPTGTGKMGDINGDNKVDIIDVGIIIDNYQLQLLQNSKADLNGDGKVDIVDIGILVDNYGL